MSGTIVGPDGSAARLAGGAITMTGGALTLNDGLDGLILDCPVVISHLP